jgi:hypothetical protein
MRSIQGVLLLDPLCNSGSRLILADTNADFEHSLLQAWLIKSHDLLVATDAAVGHSLLRARLNCYAPSVLYVHWSFVGSGTCLAGPIGSDQMHIARFSTFRGLYGLLISDGTRYQRAYSSESELLRPILYAERFGSQVVLLHWHTFECLFQSLPRIAAVLP